MTEHKTPLAAAIFATLYPASQGLAQEAQPAASDPRLEPVIVTATRRAENLQQVAQSVTALSTEFIQKQALVNTYDLIGALPSVNFVSYVPGQSVIVMRGLSGSGTGEFRIDSKVSIYLDDQPMTAISQQADVRLIDIERVEALPGPQGTLFGSSAQAGTIHYVTNKPDISGFSAETAIEVGTIEGGDQNYDVSSWVNIPVSDNFAMRAVGFWAEEGGYVDNVLGEDLFSAAGLEGGRDNADVADDNQNIYRTVGGRLSGLWTINEDWNLLTTGIYQRGDTMGTWETDPLLGDNKVTRFYDEWRDDEWWTASATLKGNLGFAELSLTASYFDRRIDYQWDNTNYAQWRSFYYSFDYFPYYAIYDTDALHSTTFNWQKQERYAYEARLTSTGDSKLKWMAGAFFEDVYDYWEYGALVPNQQNTVAWDQAQANCLAIVDETPGLTCPIAPTNIYYYNEYAATVKQLAFFGEMTYDITDKWSVTGGARWFEFERDTFDLYQVPLGLPVESDPDANGLASQSTDSDTTFRFATQYRFTPDVMVYALYSEGFRLGGNNPPRAADTGLVPATYGPDYLSNYEIGLKSQWFDNRLLLNVSAFLMEWDDIQLRLTSTSDASGCPSCPDSGAWWLEGNFNGAKAEQKGVELNGEWYATDRLSFAWNVFLASPEFTEDTFVPNTNRVFIAEGTTMPVSPKEKYWASVDYTFPNFLEAKGELWTRFSYTWQSHVWDSLSAIQDHLSDDPATVRDAAAFLIPPWESGTFQLGFTSENDWDASFIVRNVFDDAGYTYLSSTWYGELFGDDRWKHIRNLQAPRTYSLSFTKRW
jgi:outer membrane receptor protein involved in Fe transport